MRLLIVEDDTSLRRALAMGLEQPGWRIDTSPGSSDLTADRCHYDTLIISLWSGSGNSLELVRRMKVENRDLIVLALTDDWGGEALTRQEAGLFSWCCRKPVRLATMKKILQLAWKQRAVATEPSELES